MQLRKKFIQCFPGINNILHYHHITSKNILVKTYRRYNVPARLHPFVRSKFDKANLRINGEVLEQICGKHERTIQDGNEQWPFIFIIFINGISYLADLSLYFLF